MKKKILPFLALLTLFFLALSPLIFRPRPGFGEKTLPRFTKEPSGKALYRQPDQPPARRVEDLLSRMTLEEKAAQLLCPEGFPVEGLFSRGPVFHPVAMKESFPDGVGVLAGIGRVSGGLGPEQTAFTVNEIQKWCREETRLGIPVLVLEEGTRGTRSPGSTLFPSPLGLAASWNTDLTERVWQAAAAEDRSRGITLLSVPVWELFGEDPCLASLLGLAVVRGIQGSGRRIVALPGRFAETGLLLHDTMEPWTRLAENGETLWLQSGTGDRDGVPLQTGQGEVFSLWRSGKHDGSVMVSAPEGIKSLYRSTGRRTEAVLAAANGGIAMDRGETLSYRDLPALVRSGVLPEKVLDGLVRPVLMTKFLLNLFEEPWTDIGEVTRTVGIPEHSRLAREAAAGAFVLLENRRDLLPLDPEETGILAVIGPGSDRITRGEEYSQPPYYITILKGISEYNHGRYGVIRAEGCHTEEDPSDWDLLDEAERAAARADVVLLVLETSPDTGALTGRQKLLLENITDLGTPVILLLLGEVPPVIPEKADRARAVITGFSPGQESGRALAALLFGETDTAGRLPVTLMTTTEEGLKPRYPFGYGLSLTGFRWSGIKQTGEGLAVTVTNSGRRRGTETVELYISRKAVTRVYPDRELVDFRQVTLFPGETRTVTFFTGRLATQIPPDGELWLIPARHYGDSLFRMPFKPLPEP